VKKELQDIQQALERAATLTPDEIDAVVATLKQLEKSVVLTEFKLSRVEKEKRAINVLLEETIDELQKKSEAIEQTNMSLTKALEELRNTQEQLVFSEKMASLGELTAGVAHEIQNPLNFVNNFSNLTVELAEELKEDIDTVQRNGEAGDDISAIVTQIDGLIEIQQKILHHGIRAEQIVRNMLLHSRGSSGEKESADINMLVEETVSLAYQGMLGKSRNFECKLQLELEDGIPEMPLVVQDISRVLLNLFGNAFYAMNEKRKEIPGAYEPRLRVLTARKEGSVEICIEDNGNGIPDNIIDKVFNPFFTTKPTGEGTGLGLSLSFDMVRAHNGNIDVYSEAGKTTSFVVTLPIQSDS
jgi:signal transduction histidine kinase